ncbi:hypothetical protein K502DRAFT_349041 [Neoconidiobolus thromboides FSU 785]|nr:hypothetical protein K502DRAFT_349041 [Neoconidiobolus thromboides FSU 785]
MLLITGPSWPEHSFEKPTASSSINPILCNPFTIAGKPIYLVQKEKKRKSKENHSAIEKCNKDSIISHTEATANTVWDGCIVLSKYLEYQVEEGNLCLKNLRILELGSGQGILGLACAHLLAKVVFSDVQFALNKLKLNIKQNEMIQSNIEAIIELDWLKGIKDKKVDNTLLKKFDLIVAADVIWVDELVVPLCRVIDDLLYPDENSMLLCYQPRGKKVDLLLFSTLKQLNLSYDLIDFKYHHPFYKKPDIVFIYKIYKS